MTGRPSSRKPHHLGEFYYKLYRVKDVPGFPIIRCWPSFLASGAPVTEMPAGLAAAEGVFASGAIDAVTAFAPLKGQAAAARPQSAQPTRHAGQPAFRGLARPTTASAATRQGATGGGMPQQRASRW